MRLLAIDPGVNATGWALFEDGALLVCGLLRPDKKAGKDFSQKLKNLLWQAFRGLPAMPEILVIEKPQVYPGRLQIGDQNDLISISIVAGAIAGAVDSVSVFFVTPKDWKAQESKHINHKRSKERLTDLELEIADKCDVPKGLMHNVWDAIGIGLVAVHRK